ncbi:MAG: translational GTPase TypA [Spirochaeta sp.]
MINSKIRNIAIIAHVDHGKTTLVDSLFQQSGTFRANQEVVERVMDSMDLEKERGITISAKNCAVQYQDIKINIIDTPGHADFGGEVERALSMVDGTILLVDSSEGPLPQTRFVLKKALDRGLPLIVVVNKIDRKDARPQAVLDEVYGLLIDLDATEDQLEFPVIYANGRDGIAQLSPDTPGTDLKPLFDAIIEVIPGPSCDPDAPFQMLVSDLSYSDFLGRLCVGRVHNGHITAGDSLVGVGEHDAITPLKVNKLQAYQGLKLVDIEKVDPGDIIVLAGIQDVHIGDTICTKDRPVALKRLTVDEPTVSMKFYRNTSPLAGTEGSLVQPGKIKQRLEKESLVNLAIRIQDTADRDSFLVQGRGEFQLAILIETMRREGYEFCVGRPEVIMQREEGKLMEPIEHLFVDCEEGFAGVVTEKLSVRKCRMISMVNNGTGRVRMEFSAPSRALIGFRDEFLTDTKGTGLMNSYLSGYEPYRGEFVDRRNGSLVSDRSGSAVPYALYNLEPRGRMFIVPGQKVYAGMIIGEHNRDQDLDVNPCKEKKLSNMRASGKDDNVVMTPVIPLSLEQSLNFLRDDELLEVTPQSLRLRKAILDPTQRRIQAKREKSDRE